MRGVTGFIIACLLVHLFIEAALAQQVFKCSVDSGVSYQSLPCDGATLRSWDATPRAIDSATQARIESSRSTSPPKRQSRGRYRSSRSARTVTVTPCERAKRGRADAYTKAGLHRDFALSSRWDNRVHDACR